MGYGSKKKKKKLFAKLYPYYCRKLLGKLPLVIFYSVFYLALGLYLLRSFSKVENQRYLSEWFSINSWTKLLTVTWGCSFVSLFFIYLFGSMLTTELVGGYMGGQIQFGLTKKGGRGEDIKTLLFTPRIKRMDVIWTKFAATLTYLSIISFCFVTLPISIYLAISLKLSLIYLLFFLVFHGLIFTLSNLSLLVPLLFYVNAKGLLVWMFLFLLGYNCLISLSWFLFWNFISQYLFLMLIPYVALCLLVGYLFFLLWKRDFLTKDLA